MSGDYDVDVVVVGGRCAGAPVALLLARKGYSVMIVDRSTFPSDTISTHYIQPDGIGALARWGVLDELAATATCPPIEHVSWRFEDVTLAGFPANDSGARFTLAPRRPTLDHFLLRKAAEAGAEIAEAVTLEELVFEDGRVSGVVCRSAGMEFSQRCRVVVGADGRHSTVARLVGATTYDARPVMSCQYYGYWEGVEMRGYEMYAGRFRTTGMFPTDDGTGLVLALAPREEFPEFKRDVAGNFMRTVEYVAPELAERVRAGRRVERIYGTGDLPNFFRRPYGPGWALVGDAGYNKDAITAIGITDAFLDAEHLAEAIDDGLSGALPMEDAMARYEARRNERAKPFFELTVSIATLAPPNDAQLERLRSLDDQQRVDQFLGVLAGSAPVESSMVGR